MANLRVKAVDVVGSESSDLRDGLDNLIHYFGPRGALLHIFYKLVQSDPKLLSNVLEQINKEWPQMAEELAKPDTVLY